MATVTIRNSLQHRVPTSTNERMIEESYQEISGKRLRVLSRLDHPGTPLIVFNGIGASADILRPLLDAYPGAVIAYDLPGVGASPPALVPGRMRNHATLANELLQSFGIDRCHVMGVSWGGGLAQQFSLQYPGKVDHLILAATSSGHLMLPPSLAVMLRMVTPLRYLSAGYFKRVAGEIYGGDFRNNAAKAEQHARLMTPPSIWGYLSQLYALVGWTSLFRLHQIAAPTLVMAGEDDPIIPLANAKLLVNRIPNARLKTFDCGHLFVLTRLDEVIAEIGRFTAEVV